MLIKCNKCIIAKLLKIKFQGEGFIDITFFEKISSENLDNFANNRLQNSFNSFIE